MVSLCQIRLKPIFPSNFVSDAAEGFRLIFAVHERRNISIVDDQIWYESVKTISG